jgi:hypothetical protein
LFDRSRPYTRNLIDDGNGKVSPCWAFLLEWWCWCLTSRPPYFYLLCCSSMWCVLHRFRRNCCYCLYSECWFVLAGHLLSHGCVSFVFVVVVCVIVVALLSFFNRSNMVVRRHRT